MFNKKRKYQRWNNINDVIRISSYKSLFKKSSQKRLILKILFYDLTEEYYSHTSGRNCLDPVVLFKLVFFKRFLME